MFYWIRIGDGGDYQHFDGLDDAVEHLNECRIGQIDHWVDSGFGVGIDTPNFHGRDFVSLFVGDTAGNLTRHLTRWERAFVESQLAAVLD